MVGSGSALRRVAHSLRLLYAEAVHLDLSQSDPIVSGRNAIGLAVPLCVAAALGNPLAGVAAAVGALQTAFADRPGPYRLRIIRMLLTAGTAALTAALAAGLGRNVLASAVLLAVLAFAAGLLLSAGPSAAQVGLAATACALVLGHNPQTPLGAVFTGLLVLGGGAVQTVLAVAAWPLGRHRPERQALAALYRQLAALAEQPIDTATSPPLGPAIEDASAVLRGAGHDHGPSVEAYRVLLDEAVRARQDILVLSGYADRLAESARVPQSTEPALSPPAGSEETCAAADPAQAIRRELTGAAALLHAIAAMLESGRELHVTPELLAPIGDAQFAVGDSLTGQAAASRIRSLAGQLRAMVETARTGAGEGRIDEDDGRPRSRDRLRDPVAVVRANLSFESPAVRHAIRLAVLVPLCDLAARFIGIERSYWVALTILVVLRPDFAATFQRSLMRVLGTVIGLLAASALVHFVFGDSTAALIILLTVFFFGMRMSGPTNMGVSSIFLAGVVVVLLSLAGVPAHTTVVVRLIDTAIGGAIALVASLLWPSWERSQLPDRLAELLAAYRRYLQAMIDPDSTRAQRSATRSQARLARSSAEASLDRARVEPVDAQGMVELATALLAHSHRLIHALTAIDATRQAREIYAKVPRFRQLMDAVSSTLDAQQRAIRLGSGQVRDRRLRAAQAELTAALTGNPDGALPRGGDGALPRDPDGALPVELVAALVEATDRMVNSIDSMSAVLAERQRERAS